jgi:carbon-monoxide dehydrogenase medium subunit
MFPPEFDYVRPETVADALAALADGDAVPLAGGHSLVPDLKARRRAPGTLVDLGALKELRGVDHVDDELVVGACTTYADLLAADPAGVDVLTEATRAVGDRQIRNCGTVGGNLAAADPRGDLPAAALAGAATLELRDPDGSRTVPAAEFCEGDGETACADDELVTQVRLSTAPTSEAGADVGGAYAKKTHPAEGYAAVGVAARVELSGETISAASVAVNGVFESARRMGDVEQALDGVEADTVLADESVVDDAVQAFLDPVAPSDIRADHLVSGAYRRRLLPAYTRRALTRAIRRARGESVDGEVVA